MYIYKGYTQNPGKRLVQHNTGESRYTKNKCPWKLEYLQVFEKKSEALKRERILKRQNRPFIESLLTHKINILSKGTKLVCIKFFIFPSKRWERYV